MIDTNYATRVRAVVVACQFFCALAVFTSPARAAADLLTLAAKQSPNSQRAVMTAAAQVGRRVVAVGERGIIIYSDDGARTWMQAAVPVSVTLTAIAFVNTTNGWAVGHDGVVLHTADAGTTWTKQFDGTQANAMVRSAYEAKVTESRKALTAVPDATGPEAQQALNNAEAALADATAGENFGPSRPFLGVWFNTELDGFVVGAFGQIFRTKDGGKTWAFLGTRLNNPNGLHLNAITGTSSGVLLVAAEAGKVYRSDDDGESWRVYDTGYNGPLYGVLNLSADKDANTILAYGFGGRIFRSAKGGLSWEQVNSGLKSTSLVGGVVLETGAVILLAQSGSTLRSDDRALTFRVIESGKEMRVSGIARLPSGSGAISVGLGGVHLTSIGAAK